jgi:hypothetical protein
MSVVPGTRSDVPAPPPGPGVQTPFPAPPTDRSNRNLWIGLGVGGALLLVCCVGGVLGFGLLVAGGNRIVESEAKAVVQDYLDSQRKGDYNRAYTLLCRDIINRLSEGQFEERVSAERVLEFSVGDVRITNRDIVVDASVRRESGTQTEGYPVVQEGGVFKVCASP